jgi:serine/threonine protein kinase
MTHHGGPMRTRLGKYELGRVIGEGSFAKVRLAKNVETGQNFAIKVLNKERILKDKMVEQVLFIFTLLP